MSAIYQLYNRLVSTAEHFYQLLIQWAKIKTSRGMSKRSMQFSNTRLASLRFIQWWCRVMALLCTMKKSLIENIPQKAPKRTLVEKILNMTKSLFSILCSVEVFWAPSSAVARTFSHHTTTVLPVQMCSQCGVLIIKMLRLPSRCASSRLVANKHFTDIMAPQSSIYMKTNWIVGLKH